MKNHWQYQPVGVTEDMSKTQVVGALLLSHGGYRFGLAAPTHSSVVARMAITYLANVQRTTCVRNPPKDFYISTPRSTMRSTTSTSGRPTHQHRRQLRRYEKPHELPAEKSARRTELTLQSAIRPVRCGFVYPNGPIGARPRSVRTGRCGTDFCKATHVQFFLEPSKQVQTYTQVSLIRKPTQLLQ